MHTATLSATGSIFNPVGTSISTIAPAGISNAVSQPQPGAPGSDRHIQCRQHSQRRLSCYDSPGYSQCAPNHCRNDRTGSSYASNGRRPQHADQHAFEPGNNRGRSRQYQYCEPVKQPCYQRPWGYFQCHQWKLSISAHKI